MPRPNSGPHAKTFGDEFELHSKGRVGLLHGTKKYSYWTNFSRQRTEDFEVLTQNPEIPGYWWFETNLEPDDFELFMSKADTRRFLFQMVDIYRKPNDV